MKKAMVDDGIISIPAQYVKDLLGRVVKVTIIPMDIGKIEFIQKPGHEALAHVNTPAPELMAADRA